MSDPESHFFEAPSWVEIDRTTLRDNVRRIRAALPARTAPMLVVKADAYGHGAAGVAGCAAGAGVRWFAVAHPREAIAVRDAAPAADILFIGVAPPDFAPLMIERRITPIVVDSEHGRALATAAERRGARLSAHLKIDTGMGRLGFHWESAATAAAELFDRDGLAIDGICTHFARVETGEEDPARQQMDRFRKVADAVDARAGRRLFRHVSSSRAALLHPEWDLDAVRPGIVVYGYGASNPDGRVQTRPILQWKTRVAQARRVPAGFAVGYYSTYVTRAPTTLAILSLGYADGYLRALSNKGQVLIGGRRCPIVGRISMNWITVDAGPYARIVAGDEAVLIGRQGNQEIWADEMAILCRTIPYEILTNIHAGIERRFVDGDAAEG